MTDDEVFIRAIVDRPGDDTPRLVYADWLDDHDDPARAAYLRAETSWHRTKRGVKKLRGLAADLDAVWVARVSRPPFGVCLDRVRFTDRGPSVTPADLDELERRLAGQFPADYRAFLLNTNGGQPGPCRLPYPASYGWDDMNLGLGRLYAVDSIRETGLNTPGATEIEQVRAWLEELYRMGPDQGPNPLIAGMVPLADTDGQPDYFLIGVGDHNRGRVYYFGDYCRQSDDPRALSDYAPTFADFLARIGPGLED